MSFRFSRNGVVLKLFNFMEKRSSAYIKLFTKQIAMKLCTCKFKEVIEQKKKMWKDIEVIPSYIVFLKMSFYLLWVGVQTF